MSSHCEPPVDYSGSGLPRDNYADVGLAAILVNRDGG